MGCFRWAVPFAFLVVLAIPASGAAEEEEELIVLERGGRIVVVRSDGSGLRDLGTGSAPAISPDGTRIAFVEGGDVWVLARGSGVRTRITNTPGAERTPIWSPDGTRLAFASTLPSGTDTSGLDVAAADGTGIVRVASDYKAASGPPSWSGDGGELVYAAVRGLSSDVALARADGSGLRRVTYDEHADLAPVWAPVGRTIAFVRMAGAAGRLHLIEADGTGLRQISQTPVATLDRGGLAWSPDGRRIAFTDFTLLQWTRFGAVYTNDVRVLELAGAERGLSPGSERPSWSADGNRILFQTSRQGPGEDALPKAYVMNADGSCQSRVAAGTVAMQSWHNSTGPSLRCADLQLSVTQDRTMVGINQAATFALTVANLGNEPATNVRLEVEEHPNVVLELSTPAAACTVALRIGSCSLGLIPSGGATKVTAVLRASGIGALAGKAHVRAGEPDRNEAGNHATLMFDSFSCSHVGTWGDDTVVGTPVGDVVCAFTGRDLIKTLDGSDTIDSGNGDDRVFPGPGRDFVRLKGGADFVDARDGRRDVIACGTEEDIALIDRFDRFDKACEVTSATTFRCTTLGTADPDKVVASNGPDSVCVFAGNDTVATGAGSDEIDAGTGNDTVAAGSGRDIVLGGGGNDLIKVRDGARDIVRCGSGRDRVLVDRLDRAMRDCERVLRR